MPPHPKTRVSHRIQKIFVKPHANRNLDSSQYTCRNKNCLESFDSERGLYIHIYRQKHSSECFTAYMDAIERNRNEQDSLEIMGMEELWGGDFNMDWEGTLHHGQTSGDGPPSGRRVDEDDENVDQSDDFAYTWHEKGGERHGRGKNLYESFSEAKDAKLREEQRFTPFRDSADLGLASWLTLNGISQAEVDKFCNLEFVSMVLA